MVKSAPARRQVFRLSRERRVADIMAAARSVFRERGYEDAPMQDIAERANVVEGSIYRYFDSKRDLLVKVIEDWYESMLADYDQQLSGITGTRNRLRFMLWRHLKTIHDEPALCALMFQFLRSSENYSQTAVHHLNRQYTQRTLDIVREGVAAGEFRDDAPMRLVRDMIYGGIEHNTWAYLRGEGSFDPDQTAEAIIGLVLGGLEIRHPPQEPDPAGRIEAAIEKLERLAAR